MKFKVGGYYKHSGGEHMHVLVSTRTAVYGHAMIAEFSDGTFRPVGSDEANAVNWSELENKKEWDDLFS